MSESKKNVEAELGVYRARTGAGRATSAELIAAAAAVVWVAATAVFFLFVDAGNGGDGFDPLRFVMMLMTIFLPVALVWVATSAARSARIMREESERLQVTIDALRQSYIQLQNSQDQDGKASVAKKLEDVAAAQHKIATAGATFSSSRPPPQPPQPPKTAVENATTAPQQTSARSTAQVPEQALGQGSLALDTAAAPVIPPLSVSDFIKSLNFPDTPDDKEGFRVLRMALKNRKISQLIQASQDVLTLLSQDGIYMDDLNPDRARPEIWRRFAQGERGRLVAPLGGIRDRSSLALAASRMRQDTIFRDAVHHFLRKFDHMFSEFEDGASDQEIAELTNTRTARAFMLLGRVTGTFD
ncbi:hypothetical protein [Candidatus Halocynthiibacter alkanivorans]|uniref:hypothetical protein n=1 Tax=Candidatus Halocynthiibacter alkanivorans TaxID=2267619 RepID=UPI000DF13040|nr:hypothetical protein [Candidatus Halocynthiibacter alkanivorans]